MHPCYSNLHSVTCALGKGDLRKFSTSALLHSCKNDDSLENVFHFNFLFFFYVTSCD